MSSGHERCPICSDWAWMERHRCAPIWLVLDPEQSGEWEDAVKVYATDPEQAAEKWAQDEDVESGEYSIVGGTDMAVQVRRLDEPDAAPVWWVVTGESIPTYRASEAWRVQCNRCREYEDLTPERIGQQHEACRYEGSRWEAA